MNLNNNITFSTLTKVYFSLVVRYRNFLINSANVLTCKLQFQNSDAERSFQTPGDELGHPQPSPHRVDKRSGKKPATYPYKISPNRDRRAYFIPEQLTQSLQS